MPRPICSAAVPAATGQADPMVFDVLFRVLLAVVRPSRLILSRLILSRLVINRLGCAAAAWLVVGSVSGADHFRERIVPFVARYCRECHGAQTAEAQLNLERYDSALTLADDYRPWEHVLTFVARNEMPPAAASEQPTAEERRAFLATLRAVLDEQARQLAGDPGPVLPRRLTNAEYDHSIRDLTGVDIRPTQSFPVDPAAGEGFSNTGEALAMSPSLFTKLYAAAQHVADHALLTTQGLSFAPHPVATFADRSKFGEQAILQFYERHRVDYTDYLRACWQYRHRPAARDGESLEAWARRRELSSPYLTTLYQLLSAPLDADRYYLGWLRQRWHDVPGPANNPAPGASPAAGSGSNASDPVPSAAVESALQQLARDLALLARQLAPRETEAIVSNAGNGPIDHLARRRRTAAERDTFDSQRMQPQRRLQAEWKNLAATATLRFVLQARAASPVEAGGGGYILLRSLNFSSANESQYKPDDAARNLPLHKLLSTHAPEQLTRLGLGNHPAGRAVDAETGVLAVPGTWEFELPATALGGAREIRLFLDAELDRALPHATVVQLTLEPTWGEAAAAEAKRASPEEIPLPQWLVDPTQPAAQDVARSGAEFCRVFPNRFYYVDETRGLSAGFHLIEGFFRDDQPLVKRVLDEPGREELDRLWTELEFTTGITEKMLRGFVFFERSERNFLKHPDFDPFKEEDPKLVDQETLERFERVYLTRSNVRGSADELANHPIHVFFEQLRAGLRQRKEQLRRAEPAYLRDLERLAQIAYRRPLTTAERDDLRQFFQRVAEDPEQGREQAVRASLIRLLVSPFFTCRIDPPPAGETVRPLNDFALASRLSYFLWSTLPDAELLRLAEAGKLNDEATLRAQTRRMLADPRVADFAREFCGQWFGYRDFPQQEAVDRAVFRDFDDPLREAVFEEPTRLVAHLIRTNQPVTRLLDSDSTWVNHRLARHYGLPVEGRPARRDATDDWWEVTGLRERGRSGILGMAVFLTRNSQPQRTSPVKRGFWVVHKVLGEHIPAPPADVVALPAKETDTNGKTIRELLALHVADAKCARCHVRFDPVGLAMEGFDPIGRRRDRDLAGRPVDNVVALPDGRQARGVPEFADYLVRERREEFTRTLGRKLLGYALGRSLQLSDQVLLDEMARTLQNNDDRWGPLLEAIVVSAPFRQQRGRDFSPAQFRQQNQGVPR